MKIVIIDYGAGNIQSIQFAIERIGYNSILSNDPDIIKNADKVIFPGVGEASSAMAKLIESGLHILLPTLKQPVLGICLGMQLMCNKTEEGDTEGLHIFDVDIKKFTTNVKVPQIGWNTIKNLESPLFSNVKEESYVYLVHSYYASLCKDTVAKTNYGIEYTTALSKNNFYGTQFHPEKSSDIGEQILRNFLEL